MVSSLSSGVQVQRLRQDVHVDVKGEVLVMRVMGGIRRELSLELGAVSVSMMDVFPPAARWRRFSCSVDQRCWRMAGLQVTQDVERAVLVFTVVVVAAGVAAGAAVRVATHGAQRAARIFTVPPVVAWGQSTHCKTWLARSRASC